MTSEAADFVDMCVNWFPSAPGFWRDYWISVFHVGHDLLRNTRAGGGDSDGEDEEMGELGIN